MEEAELEDALDDWFLESLKTYKDLHVYQLEHPTQVIEWTSEKSVCVAGYASSKSDILELRLPPRLFAQQNKGLCAERDFRVAHGGFTDGPVHCLKHIPGTRCAVTNDGRSSDLQLWDLGGDDSDVIRRTGSVPGSRGVPGGGSRIAARLSSEPQILHGARSSDVHLTHLTSGRALYKLETGTADSLSSLQFVSDSVFLASCCDGKIYVADTRTSAAPQLSATPPHSSSSEFVPWWWTAASSGSELRRVIRLSSSGQAVVSDLRNLGGAMSRAQLDVKTRCRNLDHIQVSWAPALDDCVAVSGFSGAVQIYNTSVWGADLREAEALFEHRGHAVSPQADDPIVITSHVWHPEWSRTLLSAASDGSVHVWDWIDLSAADGHAAETS